MKFGFRLLVGCIAAAVMVFAPGCGKLKTIQEELAGLPPAERAAFDKLVADAGLTVDRIRPVGVLGIDRNPLCAAFNKGHVEAVRLTDVPLTDMDAVTALPELRVLWLTGTKIARIPDLSTSFRLTELVLEKNQITDAAGVKGCVALETLNLADNRLRDVSGISGLPKLRELTLSRNELANVAGLRILPSLETLRLDGNRLASLEELDAFPNLTTLDISRNELPTLAGLGVLPKLTTLNAASNKLTDMNGASICRLLETVDASSNPLVKWLDTPPPRAWDIKLDGVERIGNWMPNRPGYSWAGTNPYGDEYRGKPLSADSVDFFITLNNVPQMRSVELPATDRINGNKITLEVSVEKGKLRAYLVAPADGRYPKVRFGHYGWLVAEAEPGKPGKATGDLDWSGTPKPQASFTVEPLDGEVRGAKFHISR